MKETINKLRIKHFAQIPCKPFIVEVKDEVDAARIIDILAMQHLFLYNQKIIPDYSNALIVEMFEDDEWVDYFNDDEGMDFNEFENTYLLEKP